MRLRIAQALLLLIAGVVAVGLGEFGLRYVFHTAPQLELDIYRQQAGHLLLRPNLERQHVTRYWDVNVKTNSEGWRDNEPSLGHRVVLALGDSFAFGWGVELEESFLAQLEQGLQSDEPVDVIQAGVPGSATIDQERLLGELLPRYRPEVVVLALFVGNDFTETGLGGAERLRVVDGLLELAALDGESAGRSGEAWRWLARNSRVAQLLRATQFRWGHDAGPSSAPPRTWDAWMREFAQIHLRRPSPRAEAAMRETLASLDRIVERCRQDQIPLVVVALPRSFQVDSAEEQELMRAMQLVPEDVELDRPQRLLRDWATKTRTLLIDPLPEFRASAGAGGRLFYSPDAHMTPAGHRVVAHALLDPVAALMGVGEVANLGAP